MVPNSVDTVNIHTYSFVARHDCFTQEEGSNQLKQVGNDLQKMFPTSSYQGRTVQLNWKVESKQDQFADLPDQDKLNCYDFVFAIFNVDTSRRLELELLAKNACNPLTQNKLFKGSLILVVPYDKKLLEPNRQDLPKHQVRTLTTKSTFEDNYFTHPEKMIEFAYRQDKLAENTLDKAHEWHFANGKEVEETIQEIVKVKLQEIVCASTLVLPLAVAVPESEEVKLIVQQEPELKVLTVVDDELDMIKTPVNQVSRLTRLVNLIAVIIPSLVAAVAIFAMRILYPKLREIQIIGVGATAGIIMHLGINFFRRA